MPSLTNVHEKLMSLMREKGLDPKSISPASEKRIVQVSEYGTFTCNNCNASWGSPFAWVRFDLSKADAVANLKMVCKECFKKCDPKFEKDALDNLLKSAIERYLQKPT